MRLLFVTRSFWPLTGSSAVETARLAETLHTDTTSVELITPRWNPKWPEKIIYRGPVVHRLPYSNALGMGNLRYAYKLSRWMREHADRFDAVCVRGLRHDAAAVLSARSGERPAVILHAEGEEETGDAMWHQTAHFGQRIAHQCQTADALVAPSRSVAEELRQADYDSARIQVIPPGVPLPEQERSEEEQRAARADLGEVTDDLSLPDGAPLAVYAGPLHAAGGVELLIEGWRNVLRRSPAARLWLVGHGHDQSRFAQEIERRGLGNRIVLAGHFDDLEQFLLAADCVVAPRSGDGSATLLSAMAAGVPVVAGDTAGHREIIEDKIHGLLADPDDAVGFADALVEVLSNKGVARNLASAARERVCREYSLATMADRHRRLLANLTGSEAIP